MYNSLSNFELRISALFFGEARGFIALLRCLIIMNLNGIFYKKINNKSWEIINKKGYGKIPINIDHKLIMKLDKLLSKTNAKKNIHKNYVQITDNGKTISKSITITKTDSEFKDIEKTIRENDSLNNFSKYICNGNYSITTITTWTIFPLTPKLRIDNPKDVISSKWHVDGSGNCVKKIFLLLQDLDNRNGPTHFLPQKYSKKLFKSGWYPRSRISKKVNNKNSSLFENYDLMTGLRGDFFYFDPNIVLHRAGNVEEGFHRDLAMIVLKPKLFYK